MQDGMSVVHYRSVLPFRLPQQHLVALRAEWRRIFKQRRSYDGHAIQASEVGFLPSWSVRGQEHPVPDPSCRLTDSVSVHQGTCRCRPLVGAGFSISNPLSTYRQAVGRFTLSTTSRKTACGHFTASLSIRSGSGSGTQDRVFRFLPLFSTAQAALDFALDQGMGYLRPAGQPT